MTSVTTTRLDRFARGWSLRAKLAIVIVASALVPVAVVAFLDITQLRTRIFEDESALLAVSADHLADELDRFNEGYRRAVARLAGVPEIIAELREPTANLGPLTARLGVHKNGDPSVLGIGLIDRSGKIVCATEPILVGRDASRRGFVRAALAGTPLISDPYVEENGLPTIAFISPVTEGGGPVLGLAVFWLRADALWGVARQANGSAGAGSFAVILDTEGIRIGHTESIDVVFHPADTLPADAIERLVAEQRFGPDTRKLLEDVRSFPAEFERARARTLDRDSFTGVSPANHTKSIGVARRLSSTPWTVFYLVPEVTLVAPVTQLTNELVGVAAIVAILSLGAGLGLATRIVRPVRRLADATDRLAAGELSTRVAVAPGGRDELVQLGHAFDAMAERLEDQTQALRKSHDHLEDEVRQRTAELAEREQSLATTLDCIGDGVIVTDPDGTILRMNPTAQQLTGWSLAQAIGTPLADVFRIVDEVHREPVESPVARALRERRIVGLASHTLLLARNGREWPIADSAALVREPDGTLRGVVLVFRDMTAEREATRNVTASEERHRELYETSPDMHLTCEFASNLLTDCNQTLCDLLGYTKAELIGKPYAMVYFPDSAADLPRRLAVFQESGEFIDVERRLRRKNGSSIEVSLNLRAVRDGDGTIVGARAVYRDIGRRKQGDRDRHFLLQMGELMGQTSDVPAVLGAVATRLGETLAASFCIVAEIDQGADQAFIHRGGHPPTTSSMPLSAFGTIIQEEHRGGHAVVVNDAASDPRTAASYDEGYGPHGNRAFIAVPMLRDGAWVASLAVIAGDVRLWEDREVALVKLVAERLWLWMEHVRLLDDLARRAVADAVRRTQEQFQVLLDGVTDYAIFMLDPDGRVKTWNVGARRLKGYRADEIIGQHFSVFYVAEQKLHAEHVLTVARTTGRFEEEGWRVRKDGSRFWANVVITAVRSAEGTLEGFAKVTRDFSGRRLQEEELQAKQAALVQSLKEREVLLQEVHHRVKNNLQVVSSMINMQLRQVGAGPARHPLEECQTRVSAIALIHEKLYQSKSYAQVRFADYVRSLAANVLHATGVSPQNVRLELDILDVPLGIDRAIPCGLMINELMTNALKHGLKDGRAGVIRIELADLADDLLRLTVSDDGIGLPPGFDVTKSRSMGLQLVTTLAEQLDATLAIGASGGASFELTFARSALMTAAAAVLVVEDERIVAKDLQQILVEMGYDAFAIASSFDEAVRRASDRRPDIVLMDIRIKGPVDGVETARVLRERYDVPVIFLTAHADDSTIERAKVTGPHGYLMKPVKAGELRSAIEVSLHRHEMESRLREREAWFAATLRSIADPVLAMDSGGRRSFANPAAQALGEAALAEPMARALAGETVENIEHFVPHVGRWFSVNANPVRDFDGTVLGAVTVGRDTTDLRLALDQLRQAAIRDELTGLLNRRGFQDQAVRLVELANRGARPLALIYVDLNGMKAINDEHGHAAGDRALVETAQLLRRTFRTSDLLARLGGDEFVVIAPEYTEDGHGGAVRRRFAEHLAVLHAQGERSFRLSATMGITIYDPRSRRRTVDDLLAEADAKMYAAKLRRRLEGSRTVEPIG